MNKPHPNDTLFEGEESFPILPSCEHFAGSEKLINKALVQQNQMGPVFDITCDCEDGAQTGQEKALPNQDRPCAIHTPGAHAGHRRSLP